MNVAKALHLSSFFYMKDNPHLPDENFDKSDNVELSRMYGWFIFFCTSLLEVIITDLRVVFRFQSMLMIYVSINLHSFPLNGCTV